MMPSNASLVSGLFDTLLIFNAVYFFANLFSLSKKNPNYPEMGCSCAIKGGTHPELTIRLQVEGSREISGVPASSFVGAIFQSCKVLVTTIMGTISEDKSKMIELSSEQEVKVNPSIGTFVLMTTPKYENSVQCRKISSLKRKTFSLLK